MNVTYPRTVYEAQLKRIGQSIKKRREALGFTQEGFAYHAQIARTFYGRIERGEQNLALKSLFMLARHLKVSPAELIAEVTFEEICDAENIGDGVADQ